MIGSRNEPIDFYPTSYSSSSLNIFFRMIVNYLPPRVMVTPYHMCYLVRLLLRSLRGTYLIGSKPFKNNSANLVTSGRLQKRHSPRFCSSWCRRDCLHNFCDVCLQISIQIIHFVVVGKTAASFLFWIEQSTFVGTSFRLRVSCFYTLFDHFNDGAAVGMLRVLSIFFGW